VQYNRREVEVIPADDELGFAIIRRQRLEVESCNEQISLLCNIEGARLLVQGRGLAHVQPIFRVHPAPSVDRLEKLEALIASLVEAHQLDVQRWVWQGSSEPLADFLDRLPRKARPRIAAVIDRHALLTNHRSMFTQKPAPHFGVGATVYARFSSPMREVVGIFTHKEALELLGDAETAAPTSDDVILRDAVAKAGNRSKNLQRLLTKEAHLLALDSLLSKDLQQSSVDRPLRRGTLMGMKPSLLYVRLDDPPLEIKLHLKDLEKLTGERWRPDDLGAILRPPHGVDRKTLRLGDAVDLRLAGYDEKQRRWLFQM
ncbi:MAG: RNB domain-containing ribonuclease, partial [bacterium]|nr:RNB domain-containing ribonuclease [bacterium]